MQNFYKNIVQSKHNERKGGTGIAHTFEYQFAVWINCQEKQVKKYFLHRYVCSWSSFIETEMSARTTNGLLLAAGIDINILLLMSSMVYVTQYLD